MTMQPYGNNPIEKRKQDVRKYSRNTVLCVAGGLVGGLVAWWALALGFLPMAIGLIVAVAGGYYNWNKVQKIVNHKDQY